jgi:Ca2+-transporting ATPase
MSVVIEKEGQYYLMMKGALEEIIKSCTRVSQDHVISSINSEKKKQILKKQELWAASALRVLGLAYKPLPGPDWHKISEKDLETDLILLGICGMIDPPRPDAIHAVRSCISAGITPVMITGDHPLTAQAIAQKMGISQKGQAVTGHEIDGLTDEQLYKMAVNIRVFAGYPPSIKIA